MSMYMHRPGMQICESHIFSKLTCFSSFKAFDKLRAAGRALDARLRKKDDVALILYMGWSTACHNLNLRRKRQAPWTEDCRQGCI